MKITLAFLAVVFVTLPLTAASTNIDLDLECTVTGTKIDGEKSPKPFIEKFQIVLEQTENKDSAVETWVDINTEYLSDGKKYVASTIDTTAEHAIFSVASVIGAGYHRKIFVFTYILDLNAFELDRVVTSIPAGSDERTRVTCRRL